MSRIYFHTPERTAEVRGSERAHMHVFVHDLALAVLRLRASFDDDRAWLASILRNANHNPLDRDDRWVQDFETWFRAGMDGGGLVVAGAVIPPAELAANTVIAMRSPTLSLLARLEGMCEDHAWVDDPSDAEWFADLIEDARATNIFREGMGWERVAELAREVASGLPGPIVTSYSVSDDFPNEDVANWQAPICDACGGDGRPNERMKFRDADYDHCTTCDGEGALHDAWFDIADAERWRLGVEGMKARKHNRQLSPDTQNIGFLTGASVFDLLAERSEVAVP